MKLPNIRRMYAAPAGFVMIEADYRQQELYVRALVAKDDVLMDALKGDVYTEDAKGIFNLPAHLTKCKCPKDCVLPNAHIKPKARQAGKTGHLAFAYAAGTDAIHMQMLEQDPTVKYDLTAHVHKGLKTRYHRTVSYWTEEQELVRKTGYSETRILQRRRYYPREPPITEIANYPIQGTASEVTGLAMETLDGYLKRERLRNPSGIAGQFHDAIMLIVPDTAAWHRRGVELVREAMEQEHLIEGTPHRFLTDVKLGPNWADLKEVK